MIGVELCLRHLDTIVFIMPYIPHKKFSVSTIIISFSMNVIVLVKSENGILHFVESIVPNII